SRAWRPATALQNASDSSAWRKSSLRATSRRPLTLASCPRKHGAVRVLLPRAVSDPAVRRFHSWPAAALVLLAGAARARLVRSDLRSFAPDRLLPRERRAERCVVVLFAANLHVVGMRRVIDDTFPHLVVMDEAIVVGAVGLNHLLEHVKEHFGRVTLRVHGIEESLGLVVKGRLRRLERVGAGC